LNGDKWQDAGPRKRYRRLAFLWFARLVMPAAHNS